MGLICTDIELINPRDSSLKPVKTEALVDTGAMTLCYTRAYRSPAQPK